MAVDGADIWLGTDNGLFQFQDASDSIIPFPQQAALGSKMIIGVEPTSSYVYITTDKEVLQYSRTSWPFGGGRRPRACAIRKARPEP
jgi:ligand-binding sensor domain-containing protein